MRQHILSILSLIALSIYPLSLSSQNSFSPSLDMNTASGNQAVTSVDVSASQDVAIQLFGNGMQSARGISARFEYDASQVTYQGFDAGNMLPSEQVFTEHGTNPTVVQISVVPVGSVTTNSGLVGTIRFRTRGTFSGTSIQLVQGELGKSGQVESVMLNVSVELQSDLTSSSSDFDGNGRVGFSDFWAFATKFGSSHGDGTYESKYDLDSDDAIGLSDFMLFANVFGKEVSSSDSGSSTSKMYWTDRGTRKIQRADLDGSNVEALVTTGLGQPNDIVLDIGGGKMYWTDYGTNKIQRSDLDGSNVEDLVTTGTSDLQGLALDVGGGKMYWTLVNANKIQRSDLDGSNVEDLVTTGLSSAWDIVLDARGGKMYWVDNGTDKIQRSDLDGSNVEDLITTGLSRPEGLALDMVGGKMYWTDDGTNKIQRSDLDGSNVEDLVTTGLNSPAGIALDMASGKMYWTDDGTNKIQRSDLDGSNVEDLVTSSFGYPTGIALDASLDLIVKSPSVSNSNPNTDQSFTLSATVRNQGTDPSPSTTLRYYRSTDATISTDDTEVGTDAVSGLSASGASDQSVSLTAPSTPGTYYYGACVESVTGEHNTNNNCSAGVEVRVSATPKMYWTDIGTDKIQRANLDGSSVKDLVTTGLGAPRGIALDVGGGKMYWTDGNTDKIQRANLDGSSVEDLVTTGLTNSQDIALYFFLPDLIVGSPTVSNSNPNTDQSFTLSATVRNLGTDASPATTLRYYRSTDATISTDDTEVGTDAVSGLSASGASEQSIDLTAPSTPGTYYYGACVESVTGERYTNNNCSAGVQIEVGVPNRDPEFPSDEITHSVDENSAAEVTVGTPVTATDPDGDTPTYSLSGTDAESFTIVSSSGQIRTKSGVTYDYESKSTYSVTVDASDGNGGSASKSVTITLNDVNEPPSSAPSNVRVTAGDGQLTVKWDAVSNESGKPSVSGYHVERRTGTSGSWGNQQTVSGTSATWSDLTNGQEYQVRVRTANAEGESDWSSEVSGTPKSSNRNPEFSSGAVTRSVNENSSSGVDVGSPVTATDPDDDTLTYSLSGTDAGSFAIVSSSGQIRTKSGVTYDYESKSTYSVTVDASDGNGGSASKSVTINIGDVNEPPSSAPSNVRVTAGDGQLTVKWDAVSNESGKPSVSGYHVERRTGTSGSWGNQQTVSGTSATLSDLTNGQEYQVRVRTVNAEGESGWSSEVSGTPKSPNRPPEFSSGAVTRSVNENSSANVNVGSPVTATDPDNDSLTYSLSGTDAGSFTIVSSSGQIRTKSGVTYDYESKSTYSVTVDASDGNGGSASKGVTITLNDVNEPPSSAPSNVRVTSGDGQLTVEWDAVSNESGKPPVSGYHVERRTGTSGSWGNGHTISGRRPSTSATLSGLKNGQEYQVRVRARNAEGESGWSSAVSGTPMPTPSGLTVTNITLTSARASWTAPSDISSLINDYETRVYQDTTQIGRTVYTTRTYRSIAGLTEGTTYQVRVRARNSDANPNTFSAQITQDFTTLVPPPPGVPDVEDISYVFDPDTLWDEIEVSWNDGTGIVEFYEFEFTPRLSSVRNPIRINRRPGYFWGGPPGSEGSTTGYLTGEKTVHENTSVVSLLVNGTTYSIRMRAGNAGGVSGWSGSYTVYWDMDDE